jgi:hypothetical protein
MFIIKHVLKKKINNSHILNNKLKLLLFCTALMAKPIFVSHLLCSNFIAINMCLGECLCPFVIKRWIEALFYQGLCVSEVVSPAFFLNMFMVLLFENRHII